MAAHQATPSLGFSRQEHWSGLPRPPPGDLPNRGIKPESHVSCIDRRVLYHQATRKSGAWRIFVTKGRRTGEKLRFSDSSQLPCSMLLYFSPLISANLHYYSPSRCEDFLCLHIFNKYLSLYLCHIFLRIYSWVHRGRQWHATPLLFPGEFHGQRSLVGCSP